MEKKMYFVCCNYEGADSYEVVMASDIDKVYDYVSLYGGFDAYYDEIDEDDYDSEEDFYEALEDMRDFIYASFIEIFNPNDKYHARVLAEDGYIELD